MLSWQDALHRIYEISYGGENAKATVIRPQELPLERRRYVCTSDVYNRAWEIWIILSCDCPCGGPIKIWVELSNDHSGLRKMASSWKLFNYPFFSRNREPFAIWCIGHDIYSFIGDDPGGDFQERWEQNKIRLWAAFSAMYILRALR